MGCCFRKRQVEGAAELTERDTAKTGGTSGQVKKSEIVDGEVYLPHQHKPDEAVHFGVRLDDVDGQHVLSETVENSLARDAGIHDGDVLVDINGTNIEGRQVQYLLDLLREEVKHRLLLTVKRQLDEDKHVFVWTYFKVVVKENQPEVNILYLTQTDEDVMPWINVDPSQPAEYEWVGPPIGSYDIYIDETTSHYLSLSNNNNRGTVEFVSKHNPLTCTFYKYIFVGPGEPENGIVVVYSLQKYEQSVTVDALTTPEAKANSDADPTIGVTDFPLPKTGTTIPVDPRFWYQKENADNGLFSLQSVEQNGWYVSKSTSGDDATLSKTAQYFKIVPS
ncbi:uncharacterized protein LOC119737842 isoform X2 [Patiria miniata]|uniref:PDZ domain-containing protein n=1 Tax=Patiria miniata TaxID=46514 RepID=A0A914AY02_PATMI|nr:uncharacterized protein LOC119737842 isoform X2 [Patiria miniata]